jgi:menaquinone-dependent protoporphyrinogen oxidase
MAKIAVVYATTEGQTAKIAQHIAARGRSRDHQMDVRHLAELDETFDLSAYDGVMIGGSIHEGHYQRYLEKWLETHRDALARSKTALFTVCLAIHSQNKAERDEALAFPKLLEKRAHFVPTHSAVVAGALMYTQYSWLKRVVMKQISKKEGGSTDTTADHEYTDWAQVDAFTDAFVDLVTAKRA